MICRMADHFVANGYKIVMNIFIICRIRSGALQDDLLMLTILAATLVDHQS